MVTGLSDPSLRPALPLPLLVSMSDIAAFARVKRPVVSTWRRRHPDFPAAVSESSGRPLFDGAQVAEWLIASGLGNAAPAELRSELALFGIIALRERFTAWQLVETVGSLLCLRRLDGRPLVDPEEDAGDADLWAGLLRRAQRIDVEDEYVLRERAERSAVQVDPVTDPIGQALNDAWALACTFDLPPAAMTHVLPGICRTVLERAFTEAAWVRLHRAGIPEPEAERAVRGAIGLKAIAALGLFGDASRIDDVYAEVRRRCGGGRAVDVLLKCQEGSHPGGTDMPEPKRFIRAVEAVAQVVRTPEEGTQR